MSIPSPMPVATLAVGPYTVIRRPIPRTPHYTYTVMDGNTPVLVDMSYPTEDLCAEAIRKAHEVVVQMPKRGRPARRAINAAIRPKRAAA